MFKQQLRESKAKNKNFDFFQQVADELNLKNPILMESLKQKKKVRVPMYFKSFQELFNVKTKGITCPKCKSDGVTYYDYQGRSGDEGMISKCTCETCGFKFDM